MTLPIINELLMSLVSTSVINIVSENDVTPDIDIICHARYTQ